MSARTLPIDRPPSEPARRLGHFKPRLLLSEDHDLCPGCGEPVAIRLLLEVIEELGCAERVLVFELNAGQMLQDVRLGVRDKSKVQFIGGVSSHPGGLRLGALMNARAVRERILDAAADVLTPAA